MRSKGNMIKYSRLPAWSAIFFSIYTLFLFYKEGVILWIPLGVALIITLLSLILGPKDLINLLSQPISLKPVTKILIKFSAVLYFLSSMYGCIYFIINLPLNDMSSSLLPIIIIGFFFAGSAIEVSQNM